MKQRGVFLIALVLVFTYFLLFPRRSGPELVMAVHTVLDIGSRDLPTTGSPESLTSDGSPMQADWSEHPLIALDGGGVVAYLDSMYRVRGLQRTDRMAEDDRWFAVTGAGGLEVREPDGRLLVRIDDDGLPMAVDGRLFTYSPDTGDLSGYDPQNGTRLWSRSYMSPITVIDGAGTRTLVGLLDGRYQVIDETGSVVLDYRPGGSRIEAAYGGAISPDGSKIALVSGLDPQRFILLELRKNGYRPVSHHETGTNFRREVLVGFIRSGGQVLYEETGSVGVFDIGRKSLAELPLDGVLEDWVDGIIPGVFTLMVRGGTGAGMWMLTDDNRVVFESSLPPETGLIEGRGGSLFIVMGQRIAVMEMEVR